MSESRKGEAPGPVRLGFFLAFFLVAGGVAAAVLWHDVLNEVLAGRSMRISTLTVISMVLLLAVSVGLLARLLGSQGSGRG